MYAVMRNSRSDCSPAGLQKQLFFLLCILCSRESACYRHIDNLLPQVVPAPDRRETPLRFNCTDRFEQI